MVPRWPRFSVDCAPHQAFDVWARRMSAWWPRGHSVSGEPGPSVMIFIAAEAGTDVTIVHRGWERLGAAGPERRQRNRRGWTGVLDHFRSACAELPASA